MNFDQSKNKVGFHTEKNRKIKREVLLKELIYCLENARTVTEMQV